MAASERVFEPSRGARCLGRAAPWLVPLVASTGCSSLAGGSDSLEPPWRCLDEAAAALPVPGAVTEPARVGISFRDLFQAVPLPDLEVRACLAIDSACASPVGAPVRSDADGAVQLELYRGFEGYLEVQGEGIISALVFLPRVSSDQSLPQMGLVPEANLRTFNTNFGAGIDFDAGHLVIRIKDCDGLPAQNVALETDVGSRRFYMIGGLPEFGAERSGPVGVGGFVNIDAAGARVVGSFVQEDGTAWPIGTATFAVRPGWATFGDLGPASSAP
jgi:hypothetical protein